MPHVITHLYDPRHGPLRNISALPDHEAERILDEIRRTARTRIKFDYFERRKKTEEWLLSERRRKLGTPYLARPIYFFLGDKSGWRDISRSASVVMPLAMFGDDALTFTFPDSMASLPLAREDKHLAHRKSYHGQVFTLHEITTVIEKFGMPREGERYDRFIEVQVWDDRPLRSLAGTARSPCPGLAWASTSQLLKLCGR